jgi:hypothetical protein
MHDSEGQAISNPTIEYQPIFYQGTVKHFFKWVHNLSAIVQGQSIHCPRNQSPRINDGSRTGIITHREVTNGLL